MSAYDPNDEHGTLPEPDRPMNAETPKQAGAEPVWSPEPDADAMSAGIDGAPSTPGPGPMGATGPISSTPPIASNPGWWSQPAAWPAQASPAPQFPPSQPFPPAPHYPPPYQPWGPAAAAVAPFPGVPRQGAATRRVWPLVVAAALLSASLSAAGTYVVTTVVARPAAVSTTPASQPGNAQLISLTQSDAIVRVATAVKPSVVTITTSGISNLSPFSVPATGAGSGFIVSASGLILTNNHVVTGASSLTVTLDDTRQLPATVVTTDPTHDLALVKIDATGLTPVTLGDSSAIQVGQLAIAIGSPLGTFTDSVTQGIVSGTDRSITVGDQGTRTEESLSGLIQTDAAINPGNSGGPLLDASGSVVGIITASASNAQDMGFAIPINQAKQMIAQATK
jgi:S1-C subfamily serine protease